jgi:hypothetical protein
MDTKKLDAELVSLRSARCSPYKDSLAKGQPLSSYLEETYNKIHQGIEENDHTILADGLFRLNDFYSAVKGDRY